MSTDTAVVLDTEFKRGLGLYASTMVVVGSMIGSGIFLVSAEMGRQTGSPGLLLTAWIVTGVLTLAAALSYGELAAMMPRAGGQYVYCARRSRRSGDSCTAGRSSWSSRPARSRRSPSASRATPAI